MAQIAASPRDSDHSTEHTFQLPSVLKHLRKKLQMWDHDDETPPVSPAVARLPQSRRSDPRRPSDSSVSSYYEVLDLERRTDVVRDRAENDFGWAGNAGAFKQRAISTKAEAWTSQRSIAQIPLYSAPGLPQVSRGPALSSFAPIAPLGAKKTQSKPISNAVATLNADGRLLELKEQKSFEKGKARYSKWVQQRS
ncbi:hypothetical protein P389DRAFT_192409 [Cystobasidium minutum MCA 4210]|uniref:uncharacterized protein n=1 Tax=Cystobasidium minutum MCA 4210 TaxID=1397322 RepID=UPI0034CF92B1|eukprot:jgi/Rhomi1/192409/gm1.623_g